MTKLKQKFCVSVLFGFLRLFRRIDVGDPRADDFNKLMALIYRSFLFGWSNSADPTEFNDLLCQFNIELVSCCQEFYHCIEENTVLELNNACYWLAAYHALIKKEQIEIENLLRRSPVFKIKFYSTIDEENATYLNFFVGTFAAAIAVNEDEISSKINYFQSLREAELEANGNGNLDIG